MLTGSPRLERVAHRGSPRERTENTLPGFLLAVEHGADAVELDVHVTSDGVVVVHHDDAVAGCVIGRTTWPELSDIRLDDDATIPRLEEVLQALGDRATVYVELKGQRIEDAVIDVVRKHGRRYALHSFDHDAIIRVAEKAPDIPRGVLLDKDTRNPGAALRDAVKRTRPRDVWPHWSLANEKFVHAAHELETRVIAWTVNASGAAASLASTGVDGLCTDDVRILANL